MLPGGLPASPPAALSPSRRKQSLAKASWVCWWRKELSQPPLSPALQQEWHRRGSLPAPHTQVPAPSQPSCSLGHCCPLPPPFQEPASCWVQTVCGKEKMLHFLHWCWWLLVLLQRGSRLLAGTGAGTSAVLLPLGSSGRSARLAGTISSPVSATRAAKPP